MKIINDKIYNVMLLQLINLSVSHYLGRLVPYSMYLRNSIVAVSIL